MKHMFSKPAESMYRENDYLLFLEQSDSRCHVYIRVVISVALFKNTLTTITFNLQLSTNDDFLKINIYSKIRPGPHSDPQRAA
jgi:hypothetical protein